MVVLISIVVEEKLLIQVNVVEIWEISKIYCIGFWMNQKVEFFKFLFIVVQ